MNELEHLAARVAELEAALARTRGRSAGQLRADNAQHMDRTSWSAIYGSGGRPLAEVAAERQLAAQGRVWRAPADGAGWGHGAEDPKWR